MADKFSTHATDSVRLARTHWFNAPDDATYNCIRFVKGTFVKSVKLLITTAYAGGTPTLTVGWSGNKETANAAGFISNDIAAPKVTGLKVALHDTLTSWPGKYFNSASGMLTVTVAAGDATTEGVFVVFCEYAVLV